MFGTTSAEFEILASKIGVNAGVIITSIIVLSLWSLAWKGWALWTAARRNEKKWFIVLLVINTAGILEIIYLFLLGKRKK